MTIPIVSVSVGTDLPQENLVGRGGVYSEIELLWAGGMMPACRHILAESGLLVWIFLFGKAQLFTFIPSGTQDMTSIYTSLIL